MRNLAENLRASTQFLRDLADRDAGQISDAELLRRARHLFYVPADPPCYVTAYGKDCAEPGVILCEDCGEVYCAAHWLGERISVGAMARDVCDRCYDARCEGFDDMGDGIRRGPGEN